MMAVYKVPGLSTVFIESLNCEDTIQLCNVDCAWGKAVRTAISWQSLLARVPKSERHRVPKELSASQVLRKVSQLQSLMRVSSPTNAAGSEWNAFFKGSGRIGGVAHDNVSAVRQESSSLTSDSVRWLLHANWKALLSRPQWLHMSLDTTFMMRAYPERWARERHLSICFYAHGDIDYGASEFQVQAQALCLTDDGYFVLFSHHAMRTGSQEVWMEHCGCAIVAPSLESLQQWCTTHPSELPSELASFMSEKLRIPSCVGRYACEWVALFEITSFFEELDDCLKDAMPCVYEDAMLQCRVR